MGATLSAPSICEEDEEQPSAQDEVPEDSAEDKVNIRPLIAFIRHVYKPFKGNLQGKP